MQVIARVRWLEGRDSANENLADGRNPHPAAVARADVADVTDVKAKTRPMTLASEQAAWNDAVNRPETGESEDRRVAGRRVSRERPLHAGDLVAEFQRNGFAIRPGFLSSGEIEAIAADLGWLVETQLDVHGLDAASEGSELERLGRNLMRLHRSRPETQALIYDEVNRRPWIHGLAADRRLLDLATKLLSERVSIHPRLNMVISMPGDQWHLALWHQDRFYGPANHLVAYVPLHPSGADRGGLTVAPGMHASGPLPHGRHDWEIATKWLTIAPETVAAFPERRALRLEGGDLLLFDGYLPHSATVNRSDRPRLAITIRYSDLTDPSFVKRGWAWKDLAEEGLAALASRNPKSE